MIQNAWKMNTGSTRHERGLLPTFPSVKPDTDLSSLTPISPDTDLTDLVMGHRHDPCVLYTLMSAKHFLKSGEALPWWKFTDLAQKLLVSNPKGKRK